MLLFTGWQLLYRLLLHGIRIPDRFLTNSTCFSTAKLLSLFYDHVLTFYIKRNVVRSAAITINNHLVIDISDPCNGLEVYVLYIGFLYCFPGSWQRRLLFIIYGVLSIYLANTLRCGLLAWLNMFHRKWYDFSHHYVFTTLVYLLVFFLWKLYSKKGLNVAA